MGKFVDKLLINFGRNGEFELGIGIKVPLFFVFRIMIVDSVLRHLACEII